MAIKYFEVSLRQQLMIIGVMAELLQAGIDPLSVIKSGIETLDENQRQKYLDQVSGKQINDRDHLTSAIDLILKSSISFCLVIPLNTSPKYPILSMTL